MKRHLTVLSALFVLSSLAYAGELPDFLPQYYRPALRVGDEPLSFITERTTNGVSQALFTTRDEVQALLVEHIPCDRPRAGAIFNNVLIHLNGNMATNGGRFVAISEYEFHAEIVDGKATQHVFMVALPSAVQIWTFTSPDADPHDFASTFEAVRHVTDRRRYTEARAGGNIPMGHWGERIHAYAVQLLDAGNRQEGVSVLKDLLATTPFDYEGHALFFENTKDAQAATNSARIVFHNAEARELTEQAARFLGKPPIRIEDIPLLEKNKTGLQLILLPLEPCNPWLLKDAAKTFETCTGIPTHIRRLESQWEWDKPERIARERNIQAMLVRLKGEDIDFSGWTKDAYIEAMRDAMQAQDPLSRYYISEVVDQVTEKPGQYDVKPYLRRLKEMLNPIRADDARTMYVGITEANIYEGDSNFLFSYGYVGGNKPCSLLSYHMMLGETLGAEYQSRRRLIERIAKELVPAALKQVDIPRSTDPTCPYSYSGGLQRLDQKTLTLSQPVADALKKLKKTP